jgi:hypothetical protein
MKKGLLFFLVSLIAFASFSQTKKKQEEISTPLLFSSYWGPIISGNILSAQIIAIAPAVMHVKDNKGQLYQVNNFRFNYSFKSSYKDEETGQSKTIKDLRVSDFNNTNVLTTAWIESIKDNIKPGDQIIINKILFRNKVGKLMIAPDIRITVN